MRRALACCWREPPSARRKAPPINVQRVRCLANCNRALSCAMRRDGGWAYVFGGLDDRPDAEALIQGAKLLALAPRTG